MQKILAKCLAHIIKKVLSDIIHPNQTGIIGENIRQVLETIEHYEISGTPGLVFIADFEKAFDKLQSYFIKSLFKISDENQAWCPRYFIVLYCFQYLSYIIHLQCIVHVKTCLIRMNNIWQYFFNSMCQAFCITTLKCKGTASLYLPLWSCFSNNEIRPFCWVSVLRYCVQR